jgi:hypothetical protein
MEAQLRKYSNNLIFRERIVKKRKRKEEEDKRKRKSGIVQCLAPKLSKSYSQRIKFPTNQKRKSNESYKDQL